MFKRGAFDLGVPVCPIAIKYDKTFVDAFWNSRKQSFTAHLIKLMSSWSVVADVWFMEPQTIGEKETSIEFAERVRAMIAKKAGLKMVAWDGMLKYYRRILANASRDRKFSAKDFKPFSPLLGSTITVTAVER